MPCFVGIITDTLVETSDDDCSFGRLTVGLDGVGSWFWQGQ